MPYAKMSLKCALTWLCSLGRQMLKRSAAEKLTRRATTPQGPNSSNRDFAKADPNWMDSIAMIRKPKGEGCLSRRFWGEERMNEA